MPGWVQEMVTGWCTAAGVQRPEERLLRSVSRRQLRDPAGRALRDAEGRLRYEERAGKSLTPQAVLLTVAGYGRWLGVAPLRPHDLRRT
jgi:hypothetical protein